MLEEAKNYKYNFSHLKNSAGELRARQFVSKPETYCKYEVRRHLRLYRHTRASLSPSFESLEGKKAAALPYFQWRGENFCDVTCVCVALRIKVEVVFLLSSNTQT